MSVEYRLLWFDGCSDNKEKALNALASEGFYIIHVSSAGSQYSKTFLFVLERKIPRESPYRNLG